MRRIPTASVAWGLFAAALTGNAIHWFITPARHPSAAGLVTALHATQAVAGILLGIYAHRWSVHERAVELEDAHLDRTG